MIATGTTNGRPLRFFAIVMIGWIAIRLFNQPGPLLPLDPSQKFAALAATRGATPPPTALHYVKAISLPRPQSSMHSTFPKPHAPASPAEPTTHPAPAHQAMPVEHLDFVTFSMTFPNRHDASDPVYNHAPLSPSPAPLLLSAPARPDRWHGSAWLLWRENGTSFVDTTIGRLGASQAGLRIDYDLIPTARSRTAAYARATSALQRPAAPEAAIGLAIQPVRAIPVSLAVERRIALGKGARNANAVMAVGGFGPTPVGCGLEAEAYAQAGMVGFNRRDAFIDGKISLLAPLDTKNLRIGAALSGGAQPSVERLDIGPELQIRLPMPNLAARIAIEWRQRVAGRAAPTSGLAITLAADF